MRAARHGLPLMLAIIGGSPRRFAPFVDLYHRSRWRSSATSALPIGAHSPGHVAATDEQAREELWPHYAAMMTASARERGWPPITRAQFDREAGPDGALYVGAPETVAKKIAATCQGAGADALRHEVQQRHAAAPGADDQHRALRHAGGPAGPGAA